MDLGAEQKVARTESVVPMINVVFLLLVFFLMTATVAPPEPFDVAAPTSTSDQPSEVDQTLYVDSEGKMAWADHRGDAVFDAISNAKIGREEASPLIIRADRRLDASALTTAIARLAANEVRHAKLIVEAE